MNQLTNYIFQKLREENARALASEREKIVSQILSSLNDSGLIVKRATPEPTRLDAGLQVLLKKSLVEDGLTFPHLAVPTPKIKDSATTNRKTHKLRKQPTVIRTRHEGTHPSPSSVDGSIDGDDSGSYAKSDPARRKSQKTKLLQNSPLQKPQRKKLYEGKSSLPRKNTRGNFVVSREDGFSSDDNDTFEIDSKTAVMLAKSRALVSQSTKLKGEMKCRKTINDKYISGSDSDDSSDGPIDALTRIPATPNTRNPILHPTAVDCELKESNASDESRILSPDTTSELHLPERSIEKAESCERQGRSTLSLQVLNRDDWENELARQILNLYTSSQAAKARLAATSGKASPRDTSSGVGSPAPRKQLKKQAKKLPRLKNRSVNSDWHASHMEGTKVVINIPKIPPSVWFAGAGAVRAVWCAMAPASLNVDDDQQDKTQFCVHTLCEELRCLESSKKLKKYVALVEGLITARWRLSGGQETNKRLWKQLVVACNAFSNRAIETKKYPLALELLIKGNELLDNDNLVDEYDKPELKAYLSDTYGYYYYCRGKFNAGSKYLQAASRLHRLRGEWGHYAKVLLHLGCLLSRRGMHKESIEALSEVLQLVEDQRLEEGGSSAQKICMIAVCYHNIAVEQLHMKQLQEACVSSQNARRLARLSLSYSNRWLAQFERTHKIVLEAISVAHSDN